MAEQPWEMSAVSFLCFVVILSSVTATESVENSNQECISRQEFETRLERLENRLNFEMKKRQELEEEIKSLKTSHSSPDLASGLKGSNRLEEMDVTGAKSKEISDGTPPNDVDIHASKGAVKQSINTPKEGILSKITKHHDTGLRTRHRRIVTNASTVERAAFTVELQQHLTHLGLKQIIRFDHIVSQLGTGFDLRTGVFTTKTPGWFVFTLTMLIWDQGNDMEIHIVRDGAVVARCWEQGDDTDSVTQTVVLHLAVGNEVWVQTHSSKVLSQLVIGDHHTTLTGFLLYAD